MNGILAIDTASAAGIALAYRPGTGMPDKGGETSGPQDHSRQLLLAIDALIDGRREDLAAIGVITGPGSYAGLRVGIATAESLALGLGIPVFGVGTFEAVALAAGSGHEVVAIHPAGRDEFGMQRFEGGAASDAPALVSAASLVTETGGDPGRLCGEGAGAFGGREISAADRARALADAVERRLAAGERPAGLDAFYLREPNVTRPKRTPLFASGGQGNR